MVKSTVKKSFKKNTVLDIDSKIISFVDYLSDNNPVFITIIYFCKNFTPKVSSQVQR